MQIACIYYRGLPLHHLLFDQHSNTDIKYASSMKEEKIQQTLSQQPVRHMIGVCCSWKAGQIAPLHNLPVPYQRIDHQTS